MIRVLQYREYDSENTYVFHNYTDKVVEAFKELLKLTNHYPHDLKFDFEVSNVVYQDFYESDARGYCRDIYCDTIHDWIDEYKENKESILDCIKILDEYYNWNIQ